MVHRVVIRKVKRLYAVTLERPVTPIASVTLTEQDFCTVRCCVAHLRCDYCTVGLHTRVCMHDRKTRSTAVLRCTVESATVSRVLRGRIQTTEQDVQAYFQQGPTQISATWLRLGSDVYLLSPPCFVCKMRWTDSSTFRSPTDHCCNAIMLTDDSK